MSAKQKPSIYIHRYKHPDQVGWVGYIEPEDQSWILFFNLDGAKFFQNRAEDGAVIV